MYIRTGDPTRLVVPAHRGNETRLFIGGEGHFVCKSNPSEQHYETLAAYTKAKFAIDIAYKWSTWDFVACDKLPIFDKLYPHSKNNYVVTQLRKCRLTNANAGAQFIACEIMSEKNDANAIFKVSRLSLLKSLPSGLLEGLVG